MDRMSKTALGLPRLRRPDDRDGSKTENLIASKCFPLFSQQRTFGSAFADLLGG
jgi:hypothetical protein